MSDFDSKLQKWRNQGSLRYLAHHLRVTEKQVTRYWDNGLIPDCYRTRKGHRRIRYTDDTVSDVRMLVRAAKETNVAIRYHIPQINYCGTIIPVKGCNSMNDLYRRARRCGLNERDARNAAYRPRSKPSPQSRDISWDVLHAIKGTSFEECCENMRKFDLLNLSRLVKAQNPRDFRKIARQEWRELVKYFKLRDEGVLSVPPQIKAQNMKQRKELRCLLMKRDFQSFRSAYIEATELQSRILEIDAKTYDATIKRAQEQPEIMQLKIAAVRLKHLDRPRSAEELAKQLGMSSRPAMYRAYGARAIQDALRLVRNDPTAIREERNQNWTKGKKPNR